MPVRYSATQRESLKLGSRRSTSSAISSTEVPTSADLRVLPCRITIHLAEVQPVPISLLRGTVVWPHPGPVRDLRPRISIAETVWLMDALLMLRKAGMIRSAAMNLTL